MSNKPEGGTLAVLSELLEIANELRAGRPVPPTKVRDFLWWFDAQRRGYYVVKRIRDQLKEAGIDTFPDFEDAWIDDAIGFVLSDPKKSDEEIKFQPTTTDNPTAENVTGPGTDALPVMIKDRSYRIGQLHAASQKIISTKPDSTLSEVSTMMLADNISQLPVMNGDRDVKGMVSWQSIGSRLALGSGGSTARNMMEPHHEVRFDVSIFAAIPTIVAHGYVLVRAEDNKISGIVTSSDLSVEFRKLTEPFLLLSEIEGWVRSIIEAKFSLEEIALCREVSQSAKPISDISDLAFGDYVRLLQEPARWAQLGLSADRGIFCNRLNLIREIRNDVMHFKLKIRDEDLESLRDFASFLTYLGSIHPSR